MQELIQTTVPYFPTIILLVILTVILCKKQVNLLKSLLLSILFVLAIWVNAPLFIDAAVLQGSMPSGPLSWPYIYSQKENGIGYLLLANVVLFLVCYFVDFLLNNRYYTYKEVKKKYDNFVVDAAQLYIIGRDIDFLDKAEYKSQTNRIKSLRGRCELLCEKTNDGKLLNLYRSVTAESGVDIRFYQNDKSLSNLKGQIKIDQSGNMKALFMSKQGTKYIVFEMEHRFLVQAILDRYNQVYEQAEPVR